MSQVKSFLHIIKQPITYQIMYTFTHPFIHIKDKDSPVITGVIQPVNPTLIYSKKKIVYLNMDTWQGLPTWISEDAKRAIFRSIAHAITTNILQLEAPVLVATQLQMPIRDLHEVHTVFIRAMPRYQGIEAQDCVVIFS